MLHQLSLENFKAFSGPEVLQLSPITLIYGPNSSGKSSILQSLMLLKQTLEEAVEPSTALLPQGSLVDLGNYRELIHKHDLELPLGIKFQFSLTAENLERLQALLANLSTDGEMIEIVSETLESQHNVGLEIIFSYQQGINIDKISLFAGEESQPFVKYTYQKEQESLVLEEINHEHGLFTNWQNQWTDRASTLVMTKINRKLIDWNRKTIALKTTVKKRLEELEEETNSVISQLNSQLEEYEVEQETLVKKISELNNTNANLQKALQRVEKILEAEANKIEKDLSLIEEKQVEKAKLEREIPKITAPISEFQKKLSNLNSRISGYKIDLEVQEMKIEDIRVLQALWERVQEFDIDRVKADLIKISHLIGLEMTNFLVGLAVLPDEDELDYESSCLYEIYYSVQEEDEKDDKALKLSNIIILLMKVLSALVEKYLQSAVYISPLRQAPQRYYTCHENSSNQVGKFGEKIINIFYNNPEILEKINNYFDCFKLGYEVQIIPLRGEIEQGFDISNLFTIRLIDKNTKVNASFSDVGFGISQILPIIVQSLIARNQTIFIEQPELHIHPRLQTELGSLLVDCIKSPRSNQFIIETHSEHLMLRLQRLIRRGDISKNDVSVIYVDRDSTGSYCLQIRLDKEGDFIDNWPDGFFEEGYNETFADL